MKNINIQWMTQDAGLFELDWLCEILDVQETDISIVRNFEDFRTGKNSLVICNHAVNYIVGLDALRANNRQYGVFLLSDENLTETCEWLHDPNCLFSVRNYIHPMYFNHPKVTTIGLGYKRQFKKYLTHKPVEERYNAWVFAGTPHGDRRKMLDIFELIRPNQTHNCSGFCSADALTTRDYSEMMSNAIFALCPPGQDSMDSFRLYESLEAGCIPITLTRTNRLPIYPSYWEALIQSTGISKIPFILCDTWEECAEKTEELLQSKECTNIQENCTIFWHTMKIQWKKTIQAKLNLLNCLT
jgi:hypothetical protein